MMRFFLSVFNLLHENVLEMLFSDLVSKHLICIDFLKSHNQNKNENKQNSNELSYAGYSQKTKRHYPTTFLTASNTRSAWKGFTMKSLAPF